MLNVAEMVTELIESLFDGERNSRDRQRNQDQINDRVARGSNEPDQKSQKRDQLEDIIWD